MSAIPAEGTGKPCRIPKCKGEIFKLFRWHKRHDRIGAGKYDPNYRKVFDSYFCGECGVKYAFLENITAKAAT